MSGQQRVKCVRCGERLRELDLRAHTLDDCKARMKTFVYFKHRLRPFPAGHSLPSFLPPLHVDMTRGAYDGEPREEQPLLVRAERQWWAPTWVDVIVKLWSGPIFIEGAGRTAQRDQCIRHVLTMFTSGMKGQLVDACREDLRSAREVLKKFGAYAGPDPQLIEEVEKNAPPPPTTFRA